ncbi:MAG: Glycosyl transferase, family 2 [uncultured bacterium]|nr:MAG: Glycosyl transferase, family 2 [uncultured bacterium]
MELSIVTTLYCSSNYVDEFYHRASETAKQISDDYEIIFVNDGSPDDSLQKALNLHKKDPKVQVIDLSKNFGHHKALMTGIMHAKSNYIFIIDSDLEEPPELLKAFYEKIRENPDCDVIYSVREKRPGPITTRILGDAFYFILNLLSHEKFNNRMGISRIMTNRFCRSLRAFRERELFILGLMFMTGYKQLPYTINVQFKGQTTYTFRKKISLAVNAITSFSDKPLKLISYMGIIISIISGLSICYLILKKILFQNMLLGWTSLIVSIWFVGGLVLTCLGIIGIYIAKIFIETKHRPYTIIKEIYKK